MDILENQTSHDFLLGDYVNCTQFGKEYYGVVRWISEKGIHVKWVDNTHQIFHFKSTHHKQTPIKLLKHYTLID